MEDHTYTHVRAVYREGILTLLDPLALPDGAYVQLDIHLPEETIDQTRFTRYPTTLAPAQELDLLTAIIAAGGDTLN